MRECHVAHAERVGLEYVDLEGIIFAPDIVHRLDADTCRQLTAVPIEMVGNELKVAVADPYDQSTIERLEARVSGLVLEKVRLSALIWG